MFHRLLVGPILRFRSEEDFVAEEQLEVARNGAVQQAISRGKADCFVLSSAVDSCSDREHGRYYSCHAALSKAR